MGSEQIVCLANSYKHDHRCVAGISLTRMRWVRLVGHAIPGCLTTREAYLQGNKNAAPLDVIEARLADQCGSASHPEDIYLGSEPLRFVRRFDNSRDADVLSSFVSSGPEILGSCIDRVSATDVTKKPLPNSLELVQPDDLWWWIREENGKRRFRILFRAGIDGRVRYDLPLTDPSWIAILDNLPSGLHPDSILKGSDPCETILTVSLSEEFQGFHYKIVAAVIRLSTHRN
jgi:hypothetical protein